MYEWITQDSIIKSLYQMKIQEIKKTTVHVEELLYLYIHTRRVKYQTRLQSRTSDNIWITADEEFKISLHRDWELTREKFRELKVFFFFFKSHFTVKWISAQIYWVIHQNPENKTNEELVTPCVLQFIQKFLRCQVMYQSSCVNMQVSISISMQVYKSK